MVTEITEAPELKQTLKCTKSSHFSRKSQGFFCCLLSFWVKQKKYLFHILWKSCLFQILWEIIGCIKCCQAKFCITFVSKYTWCLICKFNS